MSERRSRSIPDEPINTARPLDKEFAQLAIDRGIIEVLERKKSTNKAAAQGWKRGMRLFERFALNGEPINSLKQDEGVTDVRVRQIIERVKSDIWKELPTEIQWQYPLYEVLRGKRIFTTEEEIAIIKAGAPRERHRRERQPREQVVFVRPKSHV